MNPIKHRRNEWRKGNNNSKILLKSIGFKNTKTPHLKEWLSKRANCSSRVERDDFPIKVCYDIYVGVFKTWADACYQVALFELRKSKKHNI